jgi:hypothetical protein
MNQYTFLAFELARERIHEGEMRNRLLLDADGFRTATPGLARRTLARAAASVSRGSAAIARRLDERVTESDSSLGSSPAA